MQLPPDCRRRGSATADLIDYAGGELQSDGSIKVKDERTARQIAESYGFKTEGMY